MTHVVTNGTVSTDGNSELDLSGASITGGNISNAGTLKLQGTSSLKNGSLANSGTLDVSGLGNTIDGETVTANNLLEVLSGAALTLDQSTAITNGGTVQVDGTGTLTLNNASITGGTVSNAGTINSTTGGGSINQANITNTGTIELTSGLLTIDPAASHTLTNTGTVKADGGELDITNELVTNSATLEAIDSGKLKLTTMTVTNSVTDPVTHVVTNGTVSTDGNSELDLSGASITGGNISNAGTLKLQGTSSLKNGSLANSGTLDVSGLGNTIDGETVTANNLLEVLSGAALTLDQSTAITNGGTVQVDGTGTLTLNNASITGGTVSNAGTINSTTGGGSINQANITNTGTIELTSGLLTIDPAASHTLTNTGTVKADGGELDITNELVTNSATLEAIDSGKLKLTTMTVTNSVTDPVTHVVTNGTVSTDGNSELDLSGASITGGNISNAGTLYNMSGNDTISAAVTNTGTIEVQSGSLDLSGGLTGVGTLKIDNGTTLEIAGADAQTVTFTGGTGTLQLDNTSIPFTGTITGTSSAAGNYTITGAANISTTTGDALDFNSSGGAVGTPASVTVTPSGTLTGAADGIQVIQNGVGDITLTTGGAVKGNAGHGILAEVTSTGRGNITINATGSVTGIGTGTGQNAAGVGILAENLNAADSGNVTVTAKGGVSGNLNGIQAQTAGSGTVSVEADGAINSTVRYGIRAENDGTGSVSVLTDANAVINSGGTAISALSNNANVPVSASASVTVTAHGTINFGPTTNLNGSASKGIDAGFYAGDATPHTTVNGNVLVNNDANITQTSGSIGLGINAYNYGIGNVTINEGDFSNGQRVTISAAQIGIGAYQNGANGNVAINVAANVQITTTSSYGIQAFTAGPGTISVVTADADVINSGSDGILATNGATALDASANSTITISAHGTINSGAYINANGPTTIAGILAGYNNGSTNTANPNINGTVTVNNYANISMLANTVREFGIEAFNYGNGDVTVNDETGTTISVANGVMNSAAIGAFSNVTGTGTGNVAVNLLGNASVSNTIGFGITATAAGSGTVTITTAQQSHVSGGTLGINASAAGGKLTITNNGTVSGATGVSAGTTGSNDIAITNAGSITGTGTGASNVGIKVAQAGNATGSTTITNSGTIAGTGSHAAISVAENTTGTATITNTGTIGSATNTNAIFETGGNLVINNDSVLDQNSQVVSGGMIDGAINAASTAFTNEAGATWNAVGTSTFGASSTVDNTGTINLASATVTGTSGLTITNEAGGVIDGISGNSFITGATINNSGTIKSTGGTLTIDPLQLTLTNSSTGTVKADGGELDISGENIANTGTVEALDGSTLKLSSLYVHNLDPALVHNGTVSTDGTSYLYLTGVSITDGTVDNAGTLYSYGLSSIASSIDNGGSIEIKSGTLTLSGSISGNGSATIDANATLELNLADNQKVTFNGDHAELIIDGPATNGLTSQAFTGAIHGFAATDEIDLQGIAYGGPTYATYTYDATTGVLHVYDGNGDHYDLDIGLGYAGAHFAGSDDGIHGTLITMNAADDLPAFGQTSLTATVPEQSSQTGSGSSDPVAPQTASGTLNFTDVDLTDLPAVSIVAGGQSVKWTDAHGNDISSRLTDTQKADLEAALSLTPHADNHNNGAVDWNYSITDSKLDFLGQGETLTITTTVALDDHQNLATLPTKNIVVTITGADDAPKITSAQSGSFHEDDATTEHAGGTISFTDVDLTDRPVVTAPFASYSYKAADGTTDLTLTDQQKTDLEAALTITPDAANANNGSATWSYDVADSKFDFLAQGETLTLTYTATVTDSQNVTATQPITVTIHGTEDAPQITTATSGSFHEDDATTDHAGGTISFTDVDLTDRPVVTAPFASYTYKAADGTTDLTLTDQQKTDLEAALTITPDAANANNGSATWSYDVADSKFDFLAQGETLTLTYTATVTDSQNVTATQPITVTIHGTEDAPQITTATSGSFHEDDATTDHAGGTISFTDVDLTDRPVVTAPFASYTYKAADGTTDLTLTDQQKTDLEAALTITPDAANANNGSATWSYDVADSKFDFLAQGETLTLTYTATVTDSQGVQATQPITVTIHGTNDAPVVSDNGISNASGHDFQEGNAGLSAAGTLTLSDADETDHVTVALDHVDVYLNGVLQTGSINGVSLATLKSYLTVQQGDILNGTGTSAQFNWSFNSGSQAFDFLAQGQHLSLQYTIVPDDGHTATGTGNGVVTINITGTDDAPVISSPASAGKASVADGGAFSGSGRLTATDVDNGDTQKWTLEGGTDVASESFNYGLHELNGSSNGINFDDKFNGTAPPNGPFGSGTYALSGGTIVPGSGSSPALLEGVNASPVGISINPAFYGQIVYGQFATLLTSNAPNTTAGLRSGQNFTATATFDLDNPADTTTSYGIRFSDRQGSPGANGQPPAQPGTETVDLRVVHNADGTMSVQLNELNFEAGTSTPLQSILLNSTVADNEIKLTLANSAANNGHVTASFQLYQLVNGQEVADGGPVSFTSTGQIFDNEDWTRVQTYGQSMAEPVATPGAVTANEVSYLQGQYGTLALNESTGTWNYFLNPGLASVKALGQGVTAHDIFTATVTDSSGQHVSTPIDVTVTGINDAPVITYGGSAVVSEREDTPGTISGLSVSDPDSNSGSEQIALSVAHGTITFDGQTGTSITVTDTLANINAALANGIGYGAQSNYSGTDTLHISLNDLVQGAALTTTKDIAIAVSPVADVPAVATSGASFSANAGSVITLPGFTLLSDTDGSETLSLNLSSFPAGTTFNAGHLDQASGHWLISTADIAGLNGAFLTMTPPADFGGTFSLHVDATVVDTATLQSGVVTDTKSFSNDFSVAVDKLTATNDTITDQPTFTENSDTTINTSALLANDTDSLGNPITITSVGDTNHHSANGGTVTLNGNTVTYTPASNYFGQDSFTYTVSEGNQTSTATVTFDVAASNHAPTTDITQFNMPAFDEDGTPSQATVTELFHDHFQDQDPGAHLSGLAISLTSGPNPQTVGSWEYSVDTGATWHSISALGPSNSFLVLDSSSLLQFVPVQDFHGTPDLTVAVIDNSYSGQFTTNAGAVTIAQDFGGGTSISNLLGLHQPINSVDDAPRFSDLGPAEANTENLPSLLDSDRNATVYDPEIEHPSQGFENWAGTTLTLSRDGGANADDSFGLTNDPNGFFTVSGNALISNGNTIATFTNTSGTLTITFGPTSLNETRVDKILQSITYTNTSDNPPSQVVIDYALNDNNTDGSQGSGGAQTGHGSVTVHITPVNDAPVAIGDAVLASITENAANPSGQTVGTLFANSFSDADGTVAGVAVSGDDATADQGVWQYKAAGGQWQDIGPVDPQHALLLSADTLVRFLPAQDFTGTPGSLQVHAVDNTFSGAFATSGDPATTDATQNGGSTAISAGTVHLGETVTVASAAAVTLGPADFNFDAHSYATGSVATTNTGNGSDGITLDGWVNWSGTDSIGTSSVLFYNGNGSTTGCGVLGIVTANGALELYVLAGGNVNIPTGITIAADEWHNIALTHENGVFSLYVDGAAEFTASAGVNELSGPGNVMLINGALAMSVANVSVWNTALTQSQIQGTDFSALTGSESGLVAYYPLNDGSGTTVADAVNSAGNLQINGSATWDSATGDMTLSIAPDNLQHQIFPFIEITGTAPTIQSATVTWHVNFSGTISSEGLDSGGLYHGIHINAVGNSYQLTGTASVADYEYALSHLTFASSDTVSSGTTFTVTVNDGSGDTTAVTSTINVEVSSNWDVWTGSANDYNWNNFSNWSLGHVPGPSDYVLVTGNGSDITDDMGASDGGDVTITQLHLMSSGTVLDITNSASDEHTFTITGAPDADGSREALVNEGGTFNVQNETTSSGSSSAIATSVSLNIQGNVQNTGTINVQNVTSAGSTASIVSVDIAGDVANSGNINLVSQPSGSSLTSSVSASFEGDVQNNGTIQIDGSGFGTNISSDISASFEGTVENAHTIQIENNGSGTSVTSTIEVSFQGDVQNDSDSTIRINNSASGTATASVSASFDGGVENNGTIQINNGGSGTGTGSVSATFGGDVANNGTILIQTFASISAAASVSLDFQGSVENSGTIQINNSASSIANSSASASFEGNVQNTGTIQIDNSASGSAIASASLSFDGSVQNTGTIGARGTGVTLTFGAENDSQLDPTSPGTFGTISAENGADVVFNGTTVTGGTVESDGSSIVEFNGAALNNVELTDTDGGFEAQFLVEGSGAITSFTGVDAAGGTGIFVIDESTQVTLQANATLRLEGSIDNYGVISAYGSGSEVDIDADVVGGTLSAFGGGFKVTGASTFDGSNGSPFTITDETGVSVQQGVTLSLIGEIDSSGTITLRNGASVSIEGDVTLDGGGSIFLQGSSNQIADQGAGSFAALELASQTIVGTGTIGNGYLSLQNDGDSLIEADSSALGKLEINAGSFTNFGTLIAEENATLQVDSITNLTLDPNNSEGSVLSEGTYVTSGNGHIVFEGGNNITTLDATVDVSGNWLIVSNGTALQDSLVEIAADGKLQLQGGADFIGIAQDGLRVAGIVTLDGGNLRAYGLTVEQGGFIEGNGAITTLHNDSYPALVNGGTIIAENGTLRITAPISGDGGTDILEIAGSNATLQIDATEAGSNGSYASVSGQVIFFENGGVGEKLIVAGHEVDFDHLQLRDFGLRRGRFHRSHRHRGCECLHL